ncbi:uncharacterized protein LOC115371587 isoform X2 [Myripristis murdjan]|uniref:uncharacterized protein LOC115371587 isoform X2 n=1 Tax=Myripristis murdjan TaxID=586833 RepID=UPI00117644F8|nr:uncharacterized protein LOC115371587 isoform X2 [Myripristis murdjan]
MGRNALKVMLILLVAVCHAREVTLVKTIGREPDVTPVCSNIPLNLTMLLRCNVTTEKNRGEECLLLYREERGFAQGCGSRITLIEENQTVFLHLTSLTPADSGNYTCECAYDGGMDFLRLSVTVEEKTQGQTRMDYPNLKLSLLWMKMAKTLTPHCSTQTLISTKLWQIQPIATQRSPSWISQEIKRKETDFKPHSRSSCKICENT